MRASTILVTQELGITSDFSLLIITNIPSPSPLPQADLEHTIYSEPHAIKDALF
jgi:hypothetical protein